MVTLETLAVETVREIRVRFSVKSAVLGGPATLFNPARLGPMHGNYLFRNILSGVYESFSRIYCTDESVVCIFWYR